MTDEDLGRLLRGIFSWVKAGFIIGAFTLGILVMTHWHEKLLVHGWTLVRETEPAQHESARNTFVEDAAPPRAVHHRRRRLSPPAVINDQPEAAPVVAAPVHQTETPAASLVALVVPVPQERHFIARHKGRGGCDGDLFLSQSQLRFDCPSQPSRELNLERAAVALDDDGIRDLASGRPYHFKVSGMNKDAARALFSAWMQGGNCQ